MVEKTKEKHGLNRSLEAIDFAKSNWDYYKNKKVIKEEKYIHLKEPLEAIVEEYPEYGGRKIETELQEEYGYCHGRELICELMKLWGLNMDQKARNTSKSGYRKAIKQAGNQANLVNDLEEIKLFDVAYTDFTELSYGGGDRKARLMPIIGHTSKVIFGWAVGRRRSTKLALRAWERASQMFGELEIDYEGMILHQDRDSVYTSDEWIDRLFVQEEVLLSYSMRGARGNTYMESFNGHFKNPVESIFVTSGTLDELIENVEERVKYWNQKRRHGSLENQIPMEFLEDQK